VTVLSLAPFRGGKFELAPWEIFPDMDRQYKVRHQKPSTFFSDGVASRLPVEGTVPMGYEIPSRSASAGGVARGGFTHGGDYYNTGMFGEYFGEGMPGEVEVTPAFLERGRERYEINCAICHGSSGDGAGVVSNYWPIPIANLHDPRLGDPAQYPEGAFFDTITHGKGLMGPYGGNITVADRWAIVAWIRVLQAGHSGASGAKGAPGAAVN
ncbi:MAG: cytochrome c, partial [Verrucomicrobiales bacterium]